MEDLYGVAYEAAGGTVEIAERKVDPQALAEELVRIRDAFDQVLAAKQGSAFPLNTV